MSMILPLLGFIWKIKFYRTATVLNYWLYGIWNSSDILCSDVKHIHYAVNALGILYNPLGSTTGKINEREHLVPTRGASQKRPRRCQSSPYSFVRWSNLIIGTLANSLMMQWLLTKNVSLCVRLLSALVGGTEKRQLLTSPACGFAETKCGRPRSGSEHSRSSCLSLMHWPQLFHTNNNVLWWPWPLSVPARQSVCLPAFLLLAAACRMGGCLPFRW